jgi:hypothetical protein
VIRLSPPRDGRRLGGLTTRALPRAGGVSLVKIMDRCWIVVAALAIVSMVTCAKSSPTGPSPTASGGTAQSGRQLLRRVDDRGCGHGVGLNCPRCDIKFAGPGLLEFEFAWRVSLPGPRDWVMTLTRFSTSGVFGTVYCEKLDTSVEPPFCLGVANERGDTSKNPLRLNYENVEGSPEFSLNIDCRPNDEYAITGIVNVYFTKR